MPRYPTTHIPEPKEWFPCLVTTCDARFRSMNGRTQHIHAKHTSNKSRHDDLQDFPMASQLWIRSSSPQSYAMDEDNLLQPEAPDDFNEPPTALYASRSSTQPIDVLSDNDFQPQLVEESLSSSPSCHQSSPPNHQDEEPEGRMPTTEYHPFINGRYIIFSFSIYVLNKHYRRKM